MTEHTRDDVAPAPLVVAVDGPSGSGKSSVSKAVARRLGAAYLDTGAMYRAVAWHCLHEGVDLADAEAVAAAAVAMDLDQSTDPDVEAVRVGGTDVTEAIRGPEVTDTVSTVAVVIPVREELHRRQRAAIAAAGRMVAEGRDITTVVAPDAHARVLLTASEAVRTARRSGQLAAAGETGVDAGTLHRQVAGRDARDATVSTFDRPADGVALVDSTELDFEQTVAAVLAAVEDQAGIPAVKGGRR
ncbi:(d)CMP kinase [Micrococcus luteus]|mgnify:FL=1|uniref:Cytidylate kinase n=6 Tax=Micrococcus TaxID=1269 RepID=A0AAP3AC71_MICLU|nr:MULTISPECIES: (d)CMP kinase [Micrococcus]PFH05428.1 cytidylate kinase [Micrococcaceae bacterium JKS001869]TFI14547.1 (d)CMP kinase [Thiopseudomonas sp. 4R-3cl]CVN60579.1 cytidylate kinase [Streptococcus pneumoniae]AWD23860.1 (d)CMP kinase [Micrococcus luteus]AYO49875.1 (d)CMP kinase [Micrococcus luteus]